MPCTLVQCAGCGHVLDARQWSLGTLLPGNDLASELSLTTDLTTELIAIFISSPVNTDKVQYQLCLNLNTMEREELFFIQNSRVGVLVI